MFKNKYVNPYGQDIKKEGPNTVKACGLEQNTSFFSGVVQDTS